MFATSIETLEVSSSIIVQHSLLQPYLHVARNLMICFHPGRQHESPSRCPQSRYYRTPTPWWRISRAWRRTVKVAKAPNGVALVYELATKRKECKGVCAIINITYEYMIQKDAIPELVADFASMHLSHP